jgi:hypothetical protein
MKRLADVSGRGVLQATGFAADDGGAAATASLFSGLAQSSRRLRQQLQPMLDQQAENQALEDVRDAAEARENGRTAVNVPARFALSRQAQVYNQVVEAGVLATSKSDIQDAINEARDKHRYDPEAFRAELDEYLEGYTSGLGKRKLDIRTLTAIEASAKATFAAEEGRITETVRVMQSKETQDALERRMSQVNAEVATLLERDGLNAVNSDEYAQLESEFVDMIDILVENPIYGWSAERGAEAVDGLLNSATEIVAGQGLEAVYHKDGAAAALKYIDGAVNGMTLDQQERIGARSRLSQNLSVLQQMTALERAEAKANNDETIEKLEQGARSFEADVLLRLGQGQKPTQSDLRRMAMYVEAGALKPTRMQTYVNAATSEEPSFADEQSVATFFDMARTPGTPREELEQLTLNEIGNGTLTWSARERILDEHDSYSDEQFTAGVDVIDGFFEIGIMDFNRGEVRAQKGEAVIELQEWYRQNPDATKAAVRQRARQISLELGRRAPRPPMPMLAGADPIDQPDQNNYEQWKEEAMLAAADLYSDDPEALNRNIRIINRQVEYWKNRQRYQQETIIDVTE